MLRQPSGFWGLFATDMIVRAAYQMAKSPVLPIFAASLGANKLMIGTIVGVSTLTGTVFKPLVGALSDRFGRRLFFFAALLLFAGFPFLYRFVHTPDQLVWMRVLHGTATAIFGPVTLAIVTEMSTVSRGARLGMFEMARGSGHLIAPAVAGAILTLSSPETVFTVVGLLGCAAFVPALFVRFDDSKIEAVERPSLLGDLVAGVKHAATRSDLWFVGALEFAIYGSIYSLKAFLPIFALEAGYGVWAAGLFFTFQEAAHLLVRPFGGRLGDRRGYVPTIAFGLLAIGGALVALPSTPTASVLLALAVVVGIGQGLTFPSTVALIGNRIAASHIGMGLGFYGALRNGGKVAGPIIVGALLQVFAAKLVFPGLGIAALLVAAALLVLAAPRGRVQTP
ncbi:MAG: MFS transporter [Rhodospirillaceae bacterium]|nr:MFS transporter [Rhodospirillaceae bacterium]